MKVKAKKTTEVLVSFDEQEVKILMGLIQNPIGDPAEESPESCEFRDKLFNALAGSLKQ